MIIKLNDNNYVEEISISGRITSCPLAYQAKHFYNKDELKMYTDFLEKEYSKNVYKVLSISYKETEITEKTE